MLFYLQKKNKIQPAIGELTKIYGIGIATASTILAMKYPKKYAIIDKRVIKNLKDYAGESFEMSKKGYEQYLKFMRIKAKEKGKTLRDYELDWFVKKLKGDCKTS